MASQSDTPPAASLRLRPFRGMRFDASKVGEIGAVTSPPYDVMDRPMIDRLLEGNPRNIVRLVLPRMLSDPVRSDDPYAHAAKLLARWRAEGVLRTDDAPALYVYEYGDASHRVCGLVGALELRQPEERVVLPHEDVIPQVVADRLAMMSASRANLEPILLVYDGGGSTAEILDRVRHSTPLTEVTVEDGTFHRVWSITEPPVLEAIGQALERHSALIADGHHRYATYLQLRAAAATAGALATGAVDGPADRGLVLLIDQSQFPLRLEAIHRSIAELGFEELAAPPGCLLEELGPAGPDDAPADRSGPGAGEPTAPTSGEARRPVAPSRGELLLTDGSSWRRLQRTAGGQDGRSDVELLHSVVLPEWEVGEDRVGYHHTVEQALRAARQESGLAVLLSPPSVQQVMAVAQAGKVMPRKSTSFGPKPRTGLVMRSFYDDED